MQPPSPSTAPNWHLQNTSLAHPVKSGNARPLPLALSCSASSPRSRIRGGSRTTRESPVLTERSADAHRPAQLPHVLAELRPGVQDADPRGPLAHGVSELHFHTGDVGPSYQVLPFSGVGVEVEQLLGAVFLPPDVLVCSPPACDEKRVLVEPAPGERCAYPEQGLGEDRFASRGAREEARGVLHAARKPCNLANAPGNR